MLVTTELYAHVVHQPSISRWKRTNLTTL